MSLNKKKILVLVSIFIAKHVRKTQEILASTTQYGLNILLEASMGKKVNETIFSSTF